MPMIERLNQQLKDNKWSVELVSCIVSMKREKRLAKGRNFNCFVLQRSDERDELSIFLQQLKEKLARLPDRMDFQLAVMTGDHWTACMLSIHKGHAKFLIIDSMEHFEALKRFEQAINVFFPDRTLYVYMAEEITEHPERYQHIQFDQVSCSRFTLDHLFHLSETNVFNDLETAQKNGTIVGLRTDPHFFKLNANNLPQSIAVIFRGTQSWVVLNSLPDHLKHQPINKKLVSLIQYATQHSRMTINKRGEEKFCNFAIENKRDCWLKSVRDFIARTSPEKLEDLFNARNGERCLQQMEMTKKASFSLKSAIDLGVCLFRTITAKSTTVSPSPTVGQ